MRDSETYTQGETRTDVVCPVALHFLLEMSKSAAYLHFSFFSGDRLHFRFFSGDRLFYFLYSF